MTAARHPPRLKVRIVAGSLRPRRCPCGRQPAAGTKPTPGDHPPCRPTPSRCSAPRPSARAWPPSSCPPTASRRPALARWADDIASGPIGAHKEREVLPDFLTDFFVTALGYAGPVGGSNRYTFSREKQVQAGGKFADAVLGEYRPRLPPRHVVAVEGKGPRDALDRPFAGRAMSAVD